MLEKDDGVVLKTSRSGETSVILTILSRSRGKLRLMVKGGLSPKNPSRSILAAGNHVEVVYYFKEGRSVYFVKELSLRASPATDRESLEHMAMLLAALELVNAVCYAGSPDPDTLDELIGFIAVGSTAADPLLMFLAFQIRLLQGLGALPDVAHCSRCGDPTSDGWYSGRDGAAYCTRHGDEAAKAVRLSETVVETWIRFASGPLGNCARLVVAPKTRKDLGRMIHWTYTFHVQGYSLPKSLDLI